MPIALLLDPVTAPGRPRTATFSSSATGLAPIGDAGTAVVSSYVFQIMTTAAAFSLNIKKKLRGSSETFANAGATWYEDMNAGPDTVRMGSGIGEAIEAELVKARGDDKSLGQEAFHRWLTLARYQTLSYGDPEMTMARWKEVMEMESRAQERARVC